MALITPGRPMRAELTVVRRVVVAGGRPPASRAFPGVQALPDGELLVGYRRGTDHLVTNDGVVTMARSRDGGCTWTTPTVVCSEPGWDCSGGNRLVLLPDGSVAMFVLQARWSKGASQTATGIDPLSVPDRIHVLMAEREARSFLVRSHDGGRTWSKIGGEIRLFRDWTEIAARGQAHVLDDGGWLVPAYGGDGPRQRTYTIAAVSNDGGRTWSARSIIAADRTRDFHEADLLRRRDGGYLAMIRSQGGRSDLYWSCSLDGGGTWSPPARTGLRGQAPALSRLRSGAILCAYRDREPDRPGVSYAVSDDEGASWHYRGRLYRGRHWNCGYPSLARLSDDAIVAVYYTSYGQAGSEIHALLLHDNTRPALGLAHTAPAL